MQEAPPLRPPLKWPGGKFRLLDEIAPRLPAGSRYVEPFVGSGAVFLRTDYQDSYLSDTNADLILFYETLVKQGRKFINRCRDLFADGNSADLYYERRERLNSVKPGSEKAALFLYCNRHGYNGLVRYNAEGKFNVPFGRYAQPYFPEKEMDFFAKKCKKAGVIFETTDFRRVMAQLKRGDVAYCDPPYVPLSATANFTTYSGSAFGMEEQRALAEMAEAAAKRGARVLVSNHDVPATRALYAGAKEIVDFTIRRNISCVGTGRNMVKELLAIY